MNQYSMIADPSSPLSVTTTTNNKWDNIVAQEEAVEPLLKSQVKPTTKIWKKFSNQGKESQAVNWKSIFNSRKNNKTPARTENVKPLSYDQLTLAYLLQSSYFVEIFTKFLISEFAHETILFYFEINNFRTQCGNNEFLEAEIKQKAQRIFDTYVAENAPAQINLEWDTTSKIVSAFANNRITATMFDDAQLVAFGVMEADSFVRFRGSKQFKKLLKSHEIQDIKRFGLNAHVLT